MKYLSNPLTLAVLAILVILITFSFCSKSTRYEAIEGGPYDEYNTELGYADKNKNGIWDDVEPFLEKHGTNKYLKLALEQYIKKIQEALIDPETKGLYYSANPAQASKEFNCLEKVKKLYSSDITVSDIQDAIVNTTSRTRAYLKYNQKLSGNFYPDWKEHQLGSPCDFEFQ